LGWSAANEQEQQKEISYIGNGNQSDAKIYVGRPIRVKKNTIVPEEKMVWIIINYKQNDNRARNRKRAREK